MAQHQSQCSIFSNQQLNVSNIFLCSCCFRPTATWLSFRCWPTRINPFTDSFHWAKLPNLFRKFATIEESIAYYNAMLHENIKMTTLQQRWYLLLDYFNLKNNTINFLFSCEIHSWSLVFHQFDICQVNTAQSNTLMHNIMPKKWAKFGAKIFRNFWDIAVFVLGCFILPHPVQYLMYSLFNYRQTEHIEKTNVVTVHSQITTK